MFNFILTETSLKKLVHSISRCEVLSRSIHIAKQFGIADLVPQDQSMHLADLHQLLNARGVLANPNSGPFYRLMKYLSCYGIFNVEHDQISQTGLSRALANTNIEPCADGEWIQQGNLLEYCQLPQNQLKIHHLCSLAIKIEIDVENKQFLISAESEGTILYFLNHFQLFSRAVSLFAQLDMPDFINSGLNTIAQLCEKFHLDPSVMISFLKLLQKVAIISLVGDQVSLLPAGRTLLAGDYRTSVKASMGMVNSWWWGAMAKLAVAITTADLIPSRVANGMDVFDYLEANPTERHRFDCGLANSDAEQDDAVASGSFDLHKHASVVDIGGGEGGLLTRMKAAKPDIEATLFEQPRTIALLKTRVEQYKHSLSEQKTSSAQQMDPEQVFIMFLSACHLQDGNFLDEKGADQIPKDKSLYTIKGVLHDFRDDQVIIILKNIAHAMGPQSELKIIERYIKDDNQPHSNKTSDMQMMAFFAAKERSLEDYQRLATEAGLTLDLSHAETRGNYHLITATRTSLDLENFADTQLTRTASYGATARAGLTHFTAPTGELAGQQDALVASVELTQARL